MVKMLDFVMVDKVVFQINYFWVVSLILTKGFIFAYLKRI